MQRDPLKIFQKSSSWTQVQQICQDLSKSGHTTWLAGGCVRDALLGIKPKDFDIATSATPEQVERLFPKTVAVGKSFGVIKVVTQAGDFEVASFRKDGLYIDGRRPETVEFSSPKEDALRRDFTVNALFYDIKNKKVHDFVGGMEDLKRKILRTVGEPTRRFDEDKLRILRAVRFVAQLGLKVDPQTLGAVRRMARDIEVVSGERLFMEMTKFFSGKYLNRAIPLLIETGLLNSIFGLDNLNYKKINKVKTTFLKWSLLFENYKTLNERKKIYTKLRVGGEFQKNIETVLEGALKLQNFSKLTLIEKKYLAANNLIKEIIQFYETEKKLSTQVKKFLSANKTLPKPIINSEILKNHNIDAGVRFGNLLKEGYELQLQGKIRNLSQGKSWLKKKISS